MDLPLRAWNEPAVTALSIALLMLIGYLLGSLSSAILVCRAFGHPDPRTDGSGNPGATNVLRVAGRTAAALTLAGDVLKGVLAVVLARWLVDEPAIWALAGAGAFLGHLFPLFFAFRGGKGVATALGVLVTLSPLTGAVAVAAWGLVFAVCRISSLSALVAFAITPVALYLFTGAVGLTAVVTAMVLVLVWRHSANIGRLWRGEEPRSG